MFIERVKFIENELENIGATRFAQNLVRKKGQILRFKISDLGVSAALILKQEAISVGADFIAPKHLILGEKGQYCGILVATAQQMERIIKKCEIQPFGLKKVGEILKGHLDSANLTNSQNLVKNNPRASANLETRPLRGAKNRIQASSSASADFLLEAEKRGSPPKSEKRQLLGNSFKNSWGEREQGGAALLREETSEISREGIAESSEKIQSKKPLKSFCYFWLLPKVESPLTLNPNLPNSVDSADFSQGGLPRRFCESARNDNFLDSSVASLSQNDNFSVDSAFSTQEANSSIFDEKSGLCSHERGNRTDEFIDEASGKLSDLSQKDAEFAKTPQIMGIINITDDSFFAESRVKNIDEILQKIEAMIAQGVGIIDIGAASTRPDSTQVPSEVEMERLKAPLQAIFDAGLSKRAIFSLDSYNFECTKFALEKGFHIINDVYGLRDVRLAELAKNSDRKIVLMHNSWLFPHEQDIVKSVDEFFAQKLEMLEKMGIKREQVILDVGFGFGKNSAENLRLTQNLAHFKHFGCAILMGASMKRTIGEVIGKDTDERLFGTLALHQIALDNGADIIRCHDFSAHIDMLKMWLALNERF